MPSSLSLALRVDGRPAGPLLERLLEVRVDAHADEPSTFELELGVELESNGTWSFVDDPLRGGPAIQPGQRIAIAVSFDQVREIVMDGFVDSVEVRLDGDEATAVLKGHQPGAPPGLRPDADLQKDLAARFGPVATNLVAFTGRLQAPGLHSAGPAVPARGDLDALAYGAVLRVGEPVLIKGVGLTFSGRYLVTRVLHTLGASGYQQRFEGHRIGPFPRDGGRQTRPSSDLSVPSAIGGAAVVRTPLDHGDAPAPVGHPGRIGHSDQVGRSDELMDPDDRSHSDHVDDSFSEFHFDGMGDSDPGGSDR